MRCVQFEEDQSHSTLPIHKTAAFWKFVLPVLWTLFTLVLGLLFLMILPRKVRNSNKSPAEHACLECISLGS